MLVRLRVSNSKVLSRNEQNLVFLSIQYLSINLSFSATFYINGVEIIEVLTYLSQQKTYRNICDYKKKLSCFKKKCCQQKKVQLWYIQ